VFVLNSFFLCVFSYCFIYFDFKFFTQFHVFTFNIIMWFRSVSTLLFCPISHSWLHICAVSCVCLFLIYILLYLIHFFPSVLESNFLTKLLKVVHTAYCRSQWPRGLKHEMSLPARTLGSWVRTPLWARMFV
jgi:hypothetical protein